MVIPLGRALLAAEEPIMQSQNLSMWEYIVLERLTIGSVRGQTLLAEEIRADKTRIIEVLDALQDRGLIRREPDPEDRRARLLSVTPSGRRSCVQVKRGIRKMEDRLLAELSPADRASFLRSLGRLSTHVRQKDPG